ncbi:MAG: GNAT family N-acetyltransferase [Anaerolineales bacterium]|nr:GNAT family N-acetyltransferase [Anaerolineales bacterium]
MNIRLAQPADDPELINLIAGFRHSLSELRDRPCMADPAAAAAELADYRRKDYPIYVAELQDGSLGGYLVCSLDGDVVWAESLFVHPAHRRKGIAAALYKAAEDLADELGSDTIYNWVDPGNHAIIMFLGKRGYNVLNLLELRRPYPDEELEDKIQVGDNEFFN